ncbi:LppU/SCO3897 family protein [Micromonospora zamorensis]|uniref:LppU/SCO3897 family protein n=1 Tax=Micromonospora zamorensis TaxID=709883 RepID=UPI003D92519D
MSDQVAPPSAPDAAAPQPAVETPQPTPAQPQAATSDAADPQAAKPGTADPQAAKPGTADPQAAKPDAADPQAAKPDAADPQAAKPDAVDPQAAKPDAAVPPTTATATAEPEAKKSGGGKKALGIVGAILAVVVVAGLKFGLVSAIGGFFNNDETADAKAGDCIAELPEITGTKQEKADGAKVVECTSTDAAYTVVGRVNDQSEAQAKAGTACDSFFQNDEEGYIFSSIEPGKSGYVLCLTKKA